MSIPLDWQDDADGDGSTDLPIVPSLVPTWKAPHPSERIAILLVDDVPEVLEVLTFFLDRFGFKVVPCLSAHEALQHWQADKGIELVVTDLRLGKGLSGLELAEQLQQQRPGLPVIYISAERLELQDPRLFIEGVNFLPKPFDPTLLVRLAIQMVTGGLDRHASIGPGARKLWN